MKASAVLEQAAQLLERPDITLLRHDYFTPDQKAFCTMGAVRQVISPGDAVLPSDQFQDWYDTLREIRTAICLEVGYPEQIARRESDYQVAMWNDYGRLAYVDDAQPPQPPTKEEVVAVLRRAKERLA